jgi:hypothetical protein
MTDPTSNGSGSALAWLGAKVPIWTLLAAMAGTGATSVAGGSWRWLENNEPRFVELNARLNTLDRDVSAFRAIYQQEYQVFRLDLERMATSLQTELAKKVDTTSRLEMLSVLNGRLDKIEHHLEQMDDRLTSIADRTRGTGQPNSSIRRESYNGMEGTNLSGHGAASAIAYQRQRRDRLRSVI